MSGENSRHYHSFKSEDFVGKMATLAVNCNKNQLEHVVLTRFYMGLLTLNNKFSLFSECGTAEGIKYLKKQSTNKAYVHVHGQQKPVETQVKPACCLQSCIVCLIWWHVVKKMPVQGGDFPNICLGLLPYFLGVPQVLAERGFGTQVLDGWSRMVEHLMSMVSGGLGYVTKANLKHLRFRAVRHLGHQTMKP